MGKRGGVDVEVLCFWIATGFAFAMTAHYVFASVQFTVSVANHSYS